MSQKTEGETSKAPEEDGEGRKRTNATAATSGKASMFPKSPKKDLGMLKKRSTSGDGADVSSSKRSRDAAAFSDSPDDEALVLEGMTPEELARMSRSERKRHREKKRRSDVNKGFDELMTLLLEIDPSVRAEAEERARRGQWKGQLGAQEDNLLSRVDLISRTVEVLRRVHRENEERKLIIASLTRGGAATSAGGLGSSMGPTGFGLSAGPASLGPASDEASLMLSPANADALASLRAAAESRQVYNQALLSRLAAGQQQSSLLPQNLMGFSQYSHLQGNPGHTTNASDAILFAAAARNALPGGSSLNPALLAAAAAGTGTNQSSTGTNTALTRRYLQLLHNRQDMANALAGGSDFGPSSGDGDGDVSGQEERKR